MVLIQLLFSATPVIFAAIFHMVVIKHQWLESWTYPLDHKKTYRSNRIFGNNKTYRGVFVMITASVFFTYVYYTLNQYNIVLQKYNLLNTQKYSFVFYGVLFGFGYIIGELPNSFIKRQMNVSEGKSPEIWIRIIDQVDSVLIIMLLLVAFSFFTWTHFFIGVFFYGIVHAVINYLLFLMGLRKEAF